MDPPDYLCEPPSDLKLLFRKTTKMWPGIFRKDGTSLIVGSVTPNPKQERTSNCRKHCTHRGASDLGGGNHISHYHHKKGNRCCGNGGQWHRLRLPAIQPNLTEQTCSWVKQALPGVTWFLPFLGPLMTIILLLIFGPWVTIKLQMAVLRDTKSWAQAWWQRNISKGSWGEVLLFYPRLRWLTPQISRNQLQKMDLRPSALLKREAQDKTQRRDLSLTKPINKSWGIKIETR